MKKLLLAIAAITIVLPIWFGCNKTTQNPVTSSPQQQTSQVTLLGKKYNAFNHSKITNVIETPTHIKFSTLSAPDFTNITFEDLVMTDNEFQLFLSALKSNIGGDISNINSTTAKVVTLYLTNDAATPNYQITKGLSSFSTRTDGYLEHLYYSVNNGTSLQNLNYNAQCNSFSKNDFIALLNTTFSSDVSSTPTILTIFKQPDNASNGNTVIKKLGTTLLNANVVYKQNAPHDGCTTNGCGKGGDICLYIDNSQNGPTGGPSGPSSYICTKDCKVINLNDSLNGIQPPLDEQAGYDFRDNFLSGYEIGKKYYSYYYYICYVASQFERPKNLSLLDEYNFAISTYNVANKLRSGANTNIVITTSYKNEANNIISAYKTITTNIYYQEILEDIKNDLATYVNKNKAEIIASIH